MSNNFSLNSDGLNRFLETITGFMPLEYEVQETRSTYDAFAKSKEHENSGVVWTYCSLNKEFEFESIEYLDGKRVVRRGKGQTPKEAFENRKQIGK